TYVTFHYLSPATPYGGEGFLAGLYYFVLITHIVLAAAIVPLALTSVTRAWNQEYGRHKKIARWTMPIWLYVSFTGVLVYIMISPYYSKTKDKYEVYIRKIKIQTIDQTNQ